jgi:molybdate transport system ATP-binding protein
VVLDGNALEDVETDVHLPTEERPIAMVFQDHLLFPHLSALDNVAYGPRRLGADKRSARGRALEQLEAVGASEVAQHRPGQLSGGQAQRVAIARALAVGPRLLLLDEPLAALDAPTRTALRRQLSGDRGDLMQILVTHDPEDAFTMADRVVVMEGGRVVQRGRVEEVSTHPRTAYVAALVGVNLYRGSIHNGIVHLDDGSGELAVVGHGDGPVLAIVHPRTVTISTREPTGSARNHWAGVLTDLDTMGDVVRVRLATGIGFTIVAEITSRSALEMGLRPGAAAWASVKATEIRVTPA